MKKVFVIVCVLILASCGKEKAGIGNINNLEMANWVDLAVRPSNHTEEVKESALLAVLNEDGNIEIESEYKESLKFSDIS